MDSPPTLDLTRLDVMKRLRDDAAGASFKVYEEIKEFDRQREELRSQIRAIQNQDGRIYADDRQKIEDLEHNVQLVLERRADAVSRQEEIGERLGAAGQLYRNCADFAGADPYDRRS